VYDFGRFPRTGESFAGPGELERLLSLSPAAATALLGRLERAGHVERQHDTADRRPTKRVD
jgi:DNA-binding MarR family transcriptional regulator